MLEWVHLADRSDSAVRTLSHGMMRRLTIAQAFLGSPELVLLDEPLSGLDPREAARIRDFLKARRGGQTIVISSHDLRELEALCDRVAFVEKGRLVRTDSIDKVVRRNHSLTYVVAGGKVPLEELCATLPGATFDAATEAGRLTVVFDDTQIRTEAVNAAVLPVLLKARVGVLEIRRGSDLESEYLAITAAASDRGTTRVAGRSGGGEPRHTAGVCLP
jgi:ABC-type multidrug transport system ATPase subunit